MKQGVFLAVAVLVGAALCWGLLSVLDRSEATEVRLSCRPSAPTAALAAHDGQVVLYLGNSLVFDHSWPAPEGGTSG